MIFDVLYKKVKKLDADIFYYGNKILNGYKFVIEYNANILIYKKVNTSTKSELASSKFK
jgi:hypothetical protein